MNRDCDQVRIGIVGMGNCASSFVQGLSYYRNAAAGDTVPGLMNAFLGGYHIRDIEVASAFDITRDKVGQDVRDAVSVAPNNTMRFAELPHFDVAVTRGPTLDGIGTFLREELVESELPVADVTRVLRDSGTQILVSYLPVGSQRATEWYAERALEAGCAFVNCIPVFIASDAAWRKRFEVAELPLVGDDVKSQVGATIVHRALAKLFEERGVRLDQTYQLNFGGNADFKNMLERERLVTKKLSKTRAVTSQSDVEEARVHIGPSDHVAWLTDRKMAYIRLEGTGFGGTPLSVELKLDVWDSPNSAGVVIDAVRCARLALDHRLGGTLTGPSAYFMKSPPRQYPDAVARQMTLNFISQYGTRIEDHVHLDDSSRHVRAD